MAANAEQAEASLKSSEETMTWNERLLATERKNAEWLDDRKFATLTLGTALSRLGRNAEAVPWLQRGVAYWRAEAESGLATDGQVPDRSKWQSRACTSWSEAATRRVLPPFALRLQVASCGANL